MYPVEMANSLLRPLDFIQDRGSGLTLAASLL